MDWTPYMSGLFALGGSLLVAIFALAGILIAQRHENERALRRVAYEAGMLEWKARLENGSLGTHGAVRPRDFIDLHLALSAWYNARVNPASAESISTLLDGLGERLAAQGGNPDVQGKNDDKHNESGRKHED